jgi:hypothetical protein
VSIITLPEGWRVWDVHCFRSRRGVGEGVKRVCGGRKSGGAGVEDEGGVGESDPSVGEVWTRVLYSMILKMLDGFLEDVITVDTPAAVAISAAISFVSIPPVPRLEPRVAVLTTEAHVRVEVR